MKTQLFTLLMNKKYILSLLTICLLVSCNTSEYEKLIKTEMSKDVRHDSILLGFNFGVPRPDFFIVCKELNAKKLIIQSEKSGFVEYIFPKTRKNDETLRALLWGIFNKEKIMTGLKFEFTHAAWAPWNEASKPENLIPVIKTKLIEWFPGNDFINVTTKKSHKNIWVKVDGNRRIIILEPDNVSSIKVNIDDLRLIEK